MISEFHGFCGNCGYDLGTYDRGSGHTTTCPQCKAKLKVETHERDVKVTVLSTKQERQAAPQPV